jgi:uncharacterized protein
MSKSSVAQSLAALLLATIFISSHAQTPNEDSEKEAAGTTALKPKGKLKVLGTDVPAGTTKRLSWTSGMARCFASLRRCTAMS